MRNIDNKKDVIPDDFDLHITKHNKSANDKKADEIAKNISISDEEISDITPESDLAAAIHYLNRDVIDKRTNQTTMDMNANLAIRELRGIVVNDGTVGMGLNPPECLAISRQVKRTSPSRGGRGREQVVEMTRNERVAEAPQKRGFIQSLFGIGENK